MTMHDALHPDDELLAAFAGGDADALADPALVEHLATCERCGPMVQELTLLRGALAALPDLAPSRPLRLIPPVPALLAPRAAALEWLRRLAAPAMAAGAGLVLVGAIGSIGSIGSAGAARTAADLGSRTAPSASLHEGSTAKEVPAGAVGGASATATPSGAGDGAFVGGSPAPRSQGSGSPAPTSSAPARGSLAPSHAPAAGVPNGVRPASPGQPWQGLVIAGLAIFGISASLRFALAPRAG